MKKLLLLFLLFLSLQMFSQNINDIQMQIDSLTDVKSDYQMRMFILDSKIMKLEATKSALKFKDIESFEYTIDSKLPVRIRDKDISSAEVIAEPMNGEKINLVDYNTGTGYWTVSYKGKNGFVNEILLKSNPAMEEFKKNVLIKRTLIERQGNLDGQEKIRQNLTKEFGEQNANRIISHEYWIGMSDAMARRSLGSPDDINTSVGSWGTHEQWVYSQSGLYLYFENGLLTSYQNH